MKHAITAVLAAVLITSMAGCSDTYDKIAADMLANMKSVDQALKTVVDKPTAEAAAPKIRELGISMNEVLGRLNRLGKPTKEQGDQLNGKFSSEITAVGNEIAKERNRINALGEDVSKPINESYADAIQASKISH